MDIYTLDADIAQSAKYTKGVLRFDFVHMLYIVSAKKILGVYSDVSLSFVKFL